MKIALINMPFAEVQYPSIALTQLRSVLRQRFGSRVTPRVHYLNHDFATFFGARLYRLITSLPGTVAGLGDWLFRDLAFPEIDNVEAYFRRHAPRLGLDDAGVTALLEMRRGFAHQLDELIERHALDQCDLIGFTTMFSQNVSSFAMARRLKGRNAGVVTVMGGANCETSMGSVIAKRVEAIDFVFSGPALRSLPQFIECLLEGRPDDCHRITGVLSKRKMALQLSGRRGEIGEELDLEVEVPLDYDEFLESYEKLPDDGRIPAHLFFETSRGCWWGEKSHCTFCGLNGTTMKYRAMSSDTALRQFARLFEYVPRASCFDSVDNILPREYLTEVLPQLHPPEGVQIFYEVKADLKDHEMQTLAVAGVTQIQPGIESLSTTTLKLMKKGTTAFQNLRFLQSCLRYGIQPIWGLLIGFPGEDESVYAKYVRDLPRFTHLPAPSGVFPVRFDRFSPYFTLAKEYGLKLKPYEFYEMIYPFDERDLVDLAYFFVDENYDATYATLSAKWLAPLRDAINHWHERWFERDGLLPPRLSLVGDGANIVRDTRDGTAVDHAISETGMRLLDALVSSMRVQRMVATLGDVPEAEIEAELDELTQRRLVFEERGIYMSLLSDPVHVRETETELVRG